MLAAAFSVQRASGFTRVLGRSAPLRRTMATMKVTAADVLASPKWPDEWPYSAQDFKRMDEEVDTQFYGQPRLVYHIGAHARCCCRGHCREK